MMLLFDTPQKALFIAQKGSVQFDFGQVGSGLDLGMELVCGGESGGVEWFGVDFVVWVQRMWWDELWKGSWEKYANP